MEIISCYQYKDTPRNTFLDLTFIFRSEIMEVSFFFLWLSLFFGSHFGFGSNPNYESPI